jgi:hypothetical protein
LPAFPSLQLSVRELILNISDICTYYDSIPDPIIYSYRKSPFRSVIFQVALHRNEIKYDKHALLAFKAPVALKARTAEITTQHRERERERERDAGRDREVDRERERERERAIKELDREIEAESERD